MKKVLFLATGFLMMATTASIAQNTTAATNTGNAQYLSLGPVIGFGDSWVGHMGGTSKFMPSGYLGIGLVYAKNEHWGWGGQLTIGSEGYKVAYTSNSLSMPNETFTATPLYLRMPLRAYYFFGDYRKTIRPKVYLGPTLGLKLSESDMLNGNNDGDMASQTGTFRTFDFGINAGAGVNIKLARSIWLNMDLGYFQGLADAVKDPAGNYNVNHNLAFNAGVLFGIK